MSSTEFRDNIDVTIGIGERLGCRAFNALYGNRTDDSTPDEQDAFAAENLALAARAAQRIGGTVLVEPVSGAPRYPLLTAADALAAIDRAGEENIALLLDVYHLAVNGDDVDAAIDASAGRIGHVQIADAPGRNEPGTGKLDIDRYLRAHRRHRLRRLGRARVQAHRRERRRLRLAAPRAPRGRQR